MNRRKFLITMGGTAAGAAALSVLPYESMAETIGDPKFCIGIGPKEAEPIKVNWFKMTHFMENGRKTRTMVTNEVDWAKKVFGEWQDNEGWRNDLMIEAMYGPYDVNHSENRSVIVETWVLDRPCELAVWQDAHGNDQVGFVSDEEDAKNFKWPVKHVTQTIRNGRLKTGPY